MSGRRGLFRLHLHFPVPLVSAVENIDDCSGIYWYTKRWLACWPGMSCRVYHVGAAPLAVGSFGSNCSANQTKLVKL